MWTQAWERRHKKQDPDTISLFTQLHLAHGKSIALSMLGQATVNGESALVTAGGHSIGGLVEGLTEASERYALNWGGDLLNVAGLRHTRSAPSPNAQAMNNRAEPRRPLSTPINPLSTLLQSCRIGLSSLSSPRENAAQNLAKAQQDLGELRTSVERTQDEPTQAQRDTSARRGRKRD